MSSTKSKKLKSVTELTYEMRTFADHEERVKRVYDCRHVSTNMLRAYADLIDEAHKRQVVDCCNDAVRKSREPCAADATAINCDWHDIHKQLSELSREADMTAENIYSLIRQVGLGEITADRALHLQIEDYNKLKRLSRQLEDLRARLPHV